MRVSYPDPLEQLKRGITHRNVSTSPAATATSPKAAPTGPAYLATLSLETVRHLMMDRMNRTEINVVWYDVLESSMDNDMPGRGQSDCVVELLDRAQKRRKLQDMFEAICRVRGDLGQP
jgi:hypothetical protein